MLDYSQQAKWSNGFGAQQSPINIETSNTLPEKTFSIFQRDAQYQLTQLIDDNTTIRLIGTGKATIFNREFNFQQVHFHAPTEHLLNNHQADFEIHLVHQDAIGQLLVTALMVELGDYNNQFEVILDQFSTHATTKVAIDINDWVDRRGSVGFHYLGSLTTPPLTEGAEWLVYSEPQLTISKLQLARYQKLFKSNVREVQPINNRLVYQFIDKHKKTSRS